jgi:pSer/pThr/pTyr-binding forkhead associated (FHA) protein
MAFLELYTDGESGRQYHLGDEMSLGRNPDNDIVISDPRASRHHARVTRRGESFFLEDLTSSNGTFVGDKQLSPGIRNELTDGDELRIGSTLLIFRLYRFLSSSCEIPRQTAWAPNPVR